MVGQRDWMAHRYSGIRRQYIRAKISEKLDSTFKAYSRLLSAHPLLGHREPLLTHIAGITYRSILVHRNYKLIYRVEPEDSEEADRVLIIDVWDTRMNPDFLAARIPATE